MQTLTKMTISKLLLETGHALTVDDFDLIEDLDALADAVSGVSKSEQRLLNQPHELCGLKFYPLTVAKSLWYAEKCDEWELEGVYQEAFLFWLLTLQNSEEALDKYTLRKKADKAVKRLSRKLHCTQEEMTGVYHKCLGITGDGGGDDKTIKAIELVLKFADARDDKKTLVHLEALGDAISKRAAMDTDYGGMVALMIREYGCPPEKWLYETPVEVLSELMARITKRVEQENNAGRSSAAKGGKAIAPPPSKSLEALSKLRTKVN